MWMKAYHIYLLRHGLTQANKEGRYLGRTDMPLSEEGRVQLAELRRKFVYPEANAYFVSPLRRCRESLAILYPGSEPKPAAGLTECDFGAYEGKTIDELRGDAGYREWAACGGRTAPPGGESTEQFQKRCCAAFETVTAALMSSGTDRAVIMTHGGVIMFILGTYAFPRRPFYDWLAGNGMGYEVILTPQMWMSGRALEVARRLPDGVQDAGLAGLGDMLDKFKEITGEEPPRE